MFNFVPLQDYLFYYNCLNFLFAFLLCCYIFAKPDFYQKYNYSINVFTFFYCFTIVFYVGLRPISYQFGDMGNYNKIYELIAHGADISDVGVHGDVIFYSLLSFCSRLFPAEVFFFICFLIYFFSLIVAFRRILDRNWVWGLLCTVVLFSFWQYGTNGIRNGLATSLFLLAVSSTRYVRMVIFAISFGIHSSILLPIIAYYLSTAYKNINHYYLGWLVCLLVSFFVPTIGDVISNLGFLDDKIAHYASIDDITIGTKEFRYDFLIFSMFPIVFSIIYQFKLGVSYSEVHRILLSIYLTCNGFWILIIRYPASNRFAYLSWFLYGLIMMLPFLNYSTFRYQNRVLGLFIMILYFLSITVVKG
ncbi:TPA: EpsG family protein [Photobacterium damselae]